MMILVRALVYYGYGEYKSIIDYPVSILLTELTCDSGCSDPVFVKADNTGKITLQKVALPFAVTVSA